MSIKIPLGKFLQKYSSLRSAISFFSKDFLAAIVCVGAFLFWAGVFVYKYQHFSYHDWDLALFSNVMWGLVHGQPESSLMGVHFLANHANYIAFFFTPVFLCLQHPLTLLFLKSFSFCFGAFIFYKIAKRELNQISAIVFLLAYLMYPPNVFAMLFEFDFESLALPCFFLLFYFFLEGRLRPFLWTCLFASLIKENIPLVVVCFGLFALIVKKEKKALWGGVPILIGSFIFMGSVFVFMPYLRKTLSAPHAYLNNYAYLGLASKQLAFSPFSSFGLRFFDAFFNPTNGAFFLVLFGPLLASLLSPGFLFVGLPVILQNFLSSGISQRMIYFHYAASIVPFIFMACVMSFKKIKHGMKTFSYTVVLVLFFISMMINFITYQDKIVSNVFFSKLRENVLVKDGSVGQEYLNPCFDMNFFRKKFLRKISSRDAVVATFEFLPYLSTRGKIFSFHNIIENRNPITGEQPYILSHDLDYALINFNDLWIILEVSSPERSLRVRKFLTDRFSVDSAAGNVILFKRGKKGEKFIEQVPEDYLHGAKDLKHAIDADLELGFIEMGSLDKRNMILPLTFLWKYAGKREKLYKMVFVLEKQGQRILFQGRDIGYGVWPVGFWPPKQYIKEMVWLPVGAFKGGEYILKAFVFCFETPKEWMQKRDVFDAKNNLFTIGRVVIPQADED